MDTKLAILITKLKEKTVSGKLQWEPTKRATEYSTKLPEARITIDVWVSNQGSNVADIGIYNPAGEKIETIAASMTGSFSDYNTISSLHEIIRRKALKIDETVDSIIKSLDK